MDIFNSYAVIPLDTLNSILNWYWITDDFQGLMSKCEEVGSKYNVNPDYLTQVIHDRCYEV